MLLHGQHCFHTHHESYQQISTLGPGHGWGCWASPDNEALAGQSGQACLSHMMSNSESLAASCRGSLPARATGTGPGVTLPPQWPRAAPRLPNAPAVPMGRANAVVIPGSLQLGLG